MRIRFFPMLSFILIIIFSLATTFSDDNYSPAFSEFEYKAHLNFLASDLLEGRAIGTRGGELAAAYIASQFAEVGLKPISEEDGYFQRVPLRGNLTNQESVEFSLVAGHEAIANKPVEEVVVGSELKDNEINFSEDLLFVGYGIEAPEYNWDDYKGVDVEGKTLVMLVNDPDFEKTGFGSESLTFYGRYTYKEIIARNKGAAGLILLHTDETATYGFQVVQSSWTTEQVMFIDEDRHNLGLVAWISKPAIDNALLMVGLNYDALKEKADSKDFQPMPLDLSVEAHFKQAYREFTSPNVIGVLPGTTKKDEYVVITGHYDHLGVGIPDESGDNIYNGAMDNGSGTAGILCLARAFAEGPALERSIVFFANTGEESGLLGSSYYAEHPVFPLEKTVVAINKDVMNLLGRRNGFGAYPIQYSSAEEEVKKIGEGLGLEMRSVGVDRSGFAFRSDHFSFAGHGVVTMSVGIGGANTSISEEEEKQIRDKIGRTYHQPSDEVHPLWRYDGVMQELELIYALARHWADGAPAPTMNDDNPFIATMRLFNQ